MKSGLIFDIKRYAIHDGPGIRTTVFFKGCPLQCPWCHNPEGQESNPELSFNKTRCLEGCSECIKICPQDALSRVNGLVSIDRDKCDLCGDCAPACPTEALEIIGRELSVEEVMEEIEKDRVFFEESGGGVTFSGGEPLAQLEFLKAVLDKCKKKGVHTVLDTCGYAPYEDLEKIAKKINLFLYDFKLLDDKKHQEAMGVSNKLIIQNLKKLSAKGSNIVVRIPIIEGVNDTDENIIGTAKFIASLPGIKEISLLPYHKGGRQKYSRLNKASRMDKVLAPSKEKIKKTKKKLERYGFRVKIGD
ncbi:MAG: glycyl-radical enzyme activating protein [Candidatus Aminicenantes bacterium]|nr:glycyl-radical enzyme activating protein [Candidatus Aminicenantes bacterium]